MELGLSALVNAAGALLFALAGIAILIMGWRSRRGRLVGALALGFGLTFIVQNLRPYVRDPLEHLVVLALLSLLTALCALAFARELLSLVPREERRGAHAFAGLALAVVVGLAVSAAYVFLTLPGLTPVERVVGFSLTVLFQGALTASFAVLVAAAATHLRGAAIVSASARRAVACLTIAFGSFLMFQAMALAFLETPSFAPRIAYFAMGLLSVVSLCLWIPTSRAVEPRLARNVLLALLAPAFVMVALVTAIPGYLDEFGSFGILRTIGAAFLAIGVLKYDLLGVPLPRLAARRGGLATGALATLVIVAQVAQNFLSAQYGLVVGGIIAGAFLFAASPIQRTLEGRAPPQPPARPAQDEAARREDVYRKAVRVAMADHVLTRDENVHLFELAEELGLGAGRAANIRREVEREKEGV